MFPYRVTGHSEHCVCLCTHTHTPTHTHYNASQQSQRQSKELYLSGEEEMGGESCDNKRLIEKGGGIS